MPPPTESATPLDPKPSSSSPSSADPSPPYTHELLIAELAVHAAASLTRRVFLQTQTQTTTTTTTSSNSTGLKGNNDKDKNKNNKDKGTRTKADDSPVTLGDFGAQAVVVAALRRAFPRDHVIAEEEAAVLRADDGLRARVWELVKGVGRTGREGKEELEDGNKVQDAEDPDDDDQDIGRCTDEQDMLAAIDGGQASGGAHGRVWALDPIDGTKGFLRGGQYAVCLALIVDGDVKVGVLGCPNLPVDEGKGEDGTGTAGEDGLLAGTGERGVLVSAVKGHGATIRTMPATATSTMTTTSTDPASSSSSSVPLPLSRLRTLGPRRPIHVRALDVDSLDRAIFCESVEAAHSSHSDQAEIARRLSRMCQKQSGAKEHADADDAQTPARRAVRMDSQAKYASVARGVADIYLRLPVRSKASPTTSSNSSTTTTPSKPSPLYIEKIWDHAAGDLIVREAGGVVTDAHGRRLDFGRGRLLVANTGVVVAPRSVHGLVVKVVGEVMEEGGRG